MTALAQSDKIITSKWCCYYAFATKICRIKVKGVCKRRERDACCILLTVTSKDLFRKIKVLYTQTHTRARFPFAFVQPGCEFIKFPFLRIFRNVSFVHFEIFYANLRFKYIKKSLRIRTFEKSTSAAQVNNILSLACSQACLPAYA